MNYTVWLTSAACGCLGYAAGWFGPYLPRLGPRWRFLLLGFLPVWTYTVVMLASGTSGPLRENVAWFIVGLAMLSPFFATWLIAFLLAIGIRHWRSRRS